MKRGWLPCALALLAVALVLAGCSGVRLDRTYSHLLDRTAAVSAEAARRASAGELTPQQMVDALVFQAATWRLFQDARDGRHAATDRLVPR